MKHQEEQQWVPIMIQRYCPWCHKNIGEQDTKQHARECPYFSVLVESLTHQYKEVQDKE